MNLDFGEINATKLVTLDVALVLHVSYSCRVCRNCKSVEITRRQGQSQSEQTAWIVQRN